MMKKIAALAATSLSMIALSMTPASAATLASDLGVCYMGTSGSDGAHLTLYLDEAPGDTYDARLVFVDDNKRKWDWKLFHNGDEVASNTFDLAGTNGVKTVIRNVNNRAGEDKLRYRVVNASGTVVCNVSVTYPNPPSGPQ